MSPGPTATGAVDDRATAFDRLSTSAVVLDVDGTILATNEAWRLFAHLNDAAPGTTVPGVNYLDVCDRSATAGSPAAAEVARGLRQILSGRRDRFDCVYPCPSPIEDRWFELLASAAPVTTGAGAVMLHRDITARVLRSTEASRRPDLDEVTSLPSRQAAVRHLGQQLDVARVTAEAVQVIRLGVDGLLLVTERHGRDAADELRAKVAVRVRRALMTHGRLGVLSDDDLVMTCPGMRSADAAALAELVRTILHQPFQVGGAELRVRATVSIVESDSESTVESLIGTIDDDTCADDEPARRDGCGVTIELPDMIGLNLHLETALARATPQRNVAVAVLGIDQFRMVNDHSGHLVGDEVLRLVAARLGHGFRPVDFLARLGGDQFAIVRSGGTTFDQATAFGERVAALMRDPFTVDRRELELTASVGVTTSTPSDTPASLLQDADHAMYQARRDGANCAVVYDDTARDGANRRRRLCADLPLALAHDELRLEYQPIVDISTQGTVGFEALLRWDHPDLGAIAPDEFIPVAEATGIIVAVGAFVLDEATRQLAQWSADPRVPRALWMSVNVSAHQFSRPDFAEQVRSVVAAAKIPTASLHLEITESVVMSRIDNALRTITELRALGIHVSIDDFGTGYSSLSYLSHLPVDTLKIDRSFVSDLDGSEHGSSIVDAIVSLADTLSLDVIAEGVETPEQLELLRQLGCPHAQGFIWSRSLPPTAALRWIVERPTTHPPSAKPSAIELPAIPRPSDDIGPAVLEVARATGLRRPTTADLATVLRFGPLEVGTEAGRAWLAGRDLNLTTKEFDLLAFMSRHPRRTFTRGELLQEVWHSSLAWQSPATVTEHIHRLRRRIEMDPKRPRLLTTVRGQGYQFRPPLGTIRPAV